MEAKRNVPWQLIFKGYCGIQEQLDDESMALEVYRYFVTDHIVEETNRYVESIHIYLSTVLLYSGSKVIKVPT